MLTPHRFPVLLLTAVFLLATPEADARKKGRGHGKGHARHAWVQIRASALRDWVRREVQRPAARRATASSSASFRQRDAAQRRNAALVEEARRAQRRREDVAMFVRAHPPVAMR